MQLPDSIFHSYDIRGKYGDDLTDNIALHLGKALGTYIICHIEPHSTPSVAVGRDTRPSGKSLSENFIKGVVSTGCNVVNIGNATTPMVNFSESTLKVAAGISITASHLEENNNGFKISFNKKPFGKDDYQELKKIVEMGKYEKPVSFEASRGGGKGSVEQKNVAEEYLNNIYSGLKLTRNKVETMSLSLGISQDQDGDRLIVEGVEPDLLSAIFAASILEKHPKAVIVLNVASSLSVIKYIEKHGGKVQLSKTGYPNMTTSIDQSGALFGGEISGHYFFKDKHFGYSDGLYSAARLCEILSEKDISLNQLIKQIPQYPHTPEIRVEIKDSQTAQSVVGSLIEECHKTFPEGDFLEIDGARVTLPNKSWFLIRASGTENVISLRVEAKTKAELQELSKKLQKVLTKHRVSLTL